MSFVPFSSLAFLACLPSSAFCSVPLVLFCGVLFQVLSVSMCALSCGWGALVWALGGAGSCLCWLGLVSRWFVPSRLLTCKPCHRKKGGQSHTAIHTARVQLSTSTVSVHQVSVVRNCSVTIR